LKAATPGAETTTTATTTTIAPTTVAVNTRYQSVFDIREKTEEAGVIQCTAWAIRGPGDYDVESADGTDAVVFQIHENASQAQEAADLRAALVGGLAGVDGALLGPNWSVNCGDDEDLCNELAPVLGGEVQVAEPPTG